MYAQSELSFLSAKHNKPKNTNLNATQKIDHNPNSISTFKQWIPWTQHQSLIFSDQPNIKAKLNGHKTTTKGSITLFLLKGLSLSFPQSHHLIARKLLPIIQIFCLWLKANIEQTKKEKKETPSQPPAFSSTKDVLHIHHVIVTKPCGLGWNREALL